MIQRSLLLSAFVLLSTAREGARKRTAARERHVHCGVTFHAPGNAALGLFPRFGQTRRRSRTPNARPIICMSCSNGRK